MIPASVLERPGRWRPAGTATLLGLTLLPAAPLIWRAALSIADQQALVGAGFGVALANALALALAVAAAAFLLGLPAGILAALYDFPGRALLLGLAVLPMLAPSFLWAIGWSSLAPDPGSLANRLIHGFVGCGVVMTATALPLVFLTALAACQALSRSQADAARLAGGEARLLRHAARYAAVPALVAAVLGGLITLSDPGPGQILGLRTAASEILTSFASLYDFGLAGRQSILLAAVVLLVVGPLAWFAAPRFADAVLARQTSPLRRSRHGVMGATTAVVFALFVAVGLVLPLVGLSLPLRQGSDFTTALSELGRTGENSLLYALGAAAVSVILGLAVALCVGRDRRLRKLAVAAALALVCLPPALSALGVIEIAAKAPAWTDPFLRSRFTVCLSLGVRFFPVALILCLRAWASTAPSWAQAAGLAGVSLMRYLGRVALPLLLPPIAAALVLVALLASAEVGVVLLLHPPGEASFPLAIFTVMANAPEATVASLSALYVAVAAGSLLLFRLLAQRGGHG